MICIVGINGNQGKRYKAICNFLSIPYTGFDIKADMADDICHLSSCQSDMDYYLSKSDRIILATDTNSHLYLLEKLMPLGKPILCESPVVNTHAGLNRVLNLYHLHRTQLFMVNHLAYQKNQVKEGHTYFNFYKIRTYIDCIQIVYMASQGFTIKHESPFWDLTINGMKYEKSDIDLLYKLMVQDFSTSMSKLWSIVDIEKAHDKVFKLPHS